MGFSVLFLGTGNAQSRDLGNSSCVLEREGEPQLMIDCGPSSVREFAHVYGGSLPEAIFLTHTHFDHIGGLEGLFYRVWLAEPRLAPVRLYVPVKLVEHLHRRIADHPNVLAEGGTNFWDAFQLIPVGEEFWHAGLRFSVFPVRHHEFNSTFGLGLAGHFLYTGDTRPIPEVIGRFGSRNEVIFHDCALRDSPSHTGLDDLTRSYSPEQLRRFMLYHYDSRQVGDYLQELGYQVARPGQRYHLSRCIADSASAGPQADEPLTGFMPATARDRRDA